MLENIILVNLAICLIFGGVLVNRKYDLSKLVGSEFKSLGIAFLLLIAFTINLMPLVSANDPAQPSDDDGDGVNDDDDDCPDTVTQDGWTVADNGCSYPSYLDNVWLCIGGGVTVQDLTGNDDEECSISLNYDSTYMIVTTPGIANHDMEGGPGGEINAQDYEWKLPLVPTNNTGCNPSVSTDGCEMAPDRGPVATAVNGVPFYGPEDGPGGDAVAHEIGVYEETRQNIDLGVCGAHSGPGGAYHYHFDGNCMHWHGDDSDDTYDISITDSMVFSPDTLTINVGDTVTWTNNDNMAHTATSTSGPVSFDSGNIASEGTWSFTFTEAGTYDYKCNYHSSMTASITVVEPDIIWTDYDFNKVDGGVHSPIIGFAFDGYPIYGAYGDVDGSVTLMRSNYILKDGENGYNGIDDYEYSSSNGGHLDACNGRFSATPEFPDGVYHYYSTMPVMGDNPDSNNAFPYFINCYRGNAEDSNYDGDALGGGDGPTGGGPPDADGDNVGDGWDMCSDTGDTTYPDGNPIYPRGCTEGQFSALNSDDQNAAKVAYAGDDPPAPPDEDGDGIPDPLDDCESTESGTLVYADGCAHESTETPPDGDADGVADDDDDCPNEDSSGYDADANGCIDDSDNDGVKDDVDVCPFDADDGCPAALQDVETEGECAEGDIKNEDCNSCYCEVDPDGNESWVCTEKDCAEIKEDSPGFGIFAAIISISFMAFIRKRDL